MLDKIKFLDLISGLTDIFDAALSDFAIELYYETLKEFDYESVSRACKEIIKTHKYNSMPKPAEFLEFITGNPEDKAMLAWDAVIRAVRHCGYLQAPDFEDNVISHCIAHLGGWEWLCNQTTEELKFIAKDFRQAYHVFAKRQNAEPARLTGFIERRNRELGYEKEKNNLALQKEDLCERSETAT